MPTTDDGSFPLAAQHAEAAAVILEAACEEQQAKYGTLPNTDFRTPWVWPYQDPALLDGWTLSQIETMFPFFEPLP
jgi:hypothetical protein